MNNSKNSQTPKRLIEHRTQKQSVTNIRIIVPKTVPTFVSSIFVPFSLSTSIFKYWFVLFFHKKCIKIFVPMSLKKNCLLDIHTLLSSDMQVQIFICVIFPLQIYSNIFQYKYIQIFSDTNIRSHRKLHECHTNQDHLRMNVEPDQTIIIGLHILLSCECGFSNLLKFLLSWLFEQSLQ